MKRDKYPYKILIIEDNPGDVLLVEDYLDEHIMTPKFNNAKNYKEAKEILSNPDVPAFDIILLDLSLPDKSGEELISGIIELASEEPIVVLTGYGGLSFAMKSLSLGVTDYLIKENLNSAILYKSVVYNIERFKYVKTIQESEKKYSDLFQLSPIPMFLFDLETYRFLDVNKATIRHYGYSSEEFLSMTIKDIRPEEDIPELEKAVDLSKDKDSFYFEGVFRHRKKNGDIIFVDIRSNIVLNKGKKAIIVLANDITERFKHIKTIENQNKKLRDIAWMQSHVVRAPLARMMGLINVINDEDLSDKEMVEYLAHIMDSAKELDTIVKDVVDQSQQLMTIQDTE